MINRLRAILRTLTAALLAVCALGALVAAVYHLWHPSRFSPAAPVLTAAACVAAATLLRLRRAPSPSSINRSVVVLAAVGLALRAAAVVGIPNKQVSDFETFHELAKALKDGQGFAYTGPTGISEEVALFMHRYNAVGPIATAMRLPGTPLLMAMVYTVGGTHRILGKCLNAVLGTCVGICLFLLLVNHNRRLAFWSGMLAQAYPAGIFYTNLLGTEIHFTLGVLLSALLVGRVVETQKTASALWAALAGLLIGFTSLIRPATQLIMCAYASIALAARRPRATVIALAVISIGIALPLCAWGLRNLRTLGHFEWQTTEIGLGWYTMTRGILPADKEHRLDSITDRFLKSQNEFEIAEVGKKIGKERLLLAIRDIHFVKTALLNYLKTWRDDEDALNWCAAAPGYGGSNLQKPMSVWAYALFKHFGEWFYLTVLLLAVFGAAALVKRPVMMENPGLLMLFFYCIFSCLLASVFQGQPRYHFPLMPVMIILAVNAWGSLSSQRNSEQST